MESGFSQAPSGSSAAAATEGTPTDDTEPMDSPLAVLFGRKVFPATLAGLGVITLQQISGQPSVLYYAETIFKEANVSSGGTIAVACFKLMCTVVSAYIVDGFGRRKLLICGILIQGFALALITLYFALSWDSDATLIAAMFVYVGGYQVGFGPIAWLLISEVFPLAVRGEGMALAVQTNFFWNLVVSLSFDAELNLIGSTGSFAIFLGVIFIALIFVIKFVPETKGLTLEEIESMLDAKTFSPYQRANRNARTTYQFVSAE
jgi:MFS family permease